MREDVLLQHQYLYIPAIAIKRATLKHSLNRVPVARATASAKVCGEARRIGYAGKQDTDLALYRLKIRPDSGSTITLPGLYIIDNGVFQEYGEAR